VIVEGCDLIFGKDGLFASEDRQEHRRNARNMLPREECARPLAERRTSGRVEAVPADAALMVQALLFCGGVHQQSYWRDWHIENRVACDGCRPDRPMQLAIIAASSAARLLLAGHCAS